MDEHAIEVANEAALRSLDRVKFLGPDAAELRAHLEKTCPSCYEDVRDVDDRLVCDTCGLDLPADRLREFLAQSARYELRFATCDGNEWRHSAYRTLAAAQAILARERAVANRLREHFFVLDLDRDGDDPLALASDLYCDCDDRTDPDPITQACPACALPALKEAA